MTGSISDGASPSRFEEGMNVINLVDAAIWHIISRAISTGKVNSFVANIPSFDGDGRIPTAS